MSATDPTRKETSVTVATPEPVNLPIVTGGNAAGLAVLGDWLTAANDARSLAQQLVHSFFVPMAYKPQGQNGTEVAVANATGAILLGQSLGLDPLTSLQQIYVVHGRPGMYSKMKVALAQREGHRIWEEEYSPERSTWAGQRKGSEDVVRITLTIEDAKRAGWTSNAAYAKTPADMLAARCSSRVVDRIAADALFGLRSIEDLDDEPEPAVTVARVDAKAILASAPAPVVVNTADRIEVAERFTPTTSPAAASPTERAPQQKEVAAEVGPAATSPDPATSVETLWKRINAWFSGSGLRDVNGPGQKEARLRVINALVADEGRVITRGSELTEDEARIVLDTLAANGIQVVADVLHGTNITLAARPVDASSEVANPDRVAAEGAYQGQADAQAEAEQQDDEPDLKPAADDPWRGQGGE